MVYLELSLFGGIIFLITATLDYLIARRPVVSSSNINTGASHPSEVPVGSRPSEVTLSKKIRSVISRCLTPITGYLFAVVLQLPLLFETAGVI